MDDREVAKYFAGLLVIWGAPFSLEPPDDSVTALTSILGLAIALMGFRLSYLAWASHKVEPLLTCLVPLAFCIGVQLVLTVLALVVVGGSLLVMFAPSVAPEFPELNDGTHQVLVIVVYFLLQSLYWYLLRRQIRWLGSPPG